LLCKKCYSYPICFFHGKTSSLNLRILRMRIVISVARVFDKYIGLLWLYSDIVLQTCLCGRKYTVFTRNDMLELEHAAKSFQQEKECIDALSLTSIFSYNINECIKDLKVCENVNYEIDSPFSCIASILHFFIFHSKLLNLLYTIDFNIWN
jgi:hypothetical protein